MSTKYLVIYTVAMTITLRILIKDNVTYFAASALSGVIYGAIAGLTAKR